MLNQVLYKNSAVKVSAYGQLRSDLGHMAAAVGMPPSLSALLDAVDWLRRPAVATKPKPIGHDAIQINVPRVPAPPWVDSLP